MDKKQAAELVRELIRKSRSSTNFSGSTNSVSSSTKNSSSTNLRTCIVCHHELSPENFYSYRSTNGRTYYRSYCKQCDNSKRTATMRKPSNR